MLGIETSCDDTGIGIYHAKQGLLAHLRHSQTTTHAPYGGVVPELSSRDHIKHTLPLIHQTLALAQLELPALDGIAYTRGPGLIGALFVGSALGRALGYALSIPTIGIHHMEGHLLAPLLEAHQPNYPFIALLVSGGHTMLVEVRSFGNYTILGQTIDDAAGEAFDKTARLLGLGYPGGPLIAKLAAQGTAQNFNFPRPLLNKPGYDFSFSGLKTAVRNAWENSDKREQTKADIACGFEHAVIDTLIQKSLRALTDTGHAQLVIAGGVSANQLLREKLQEIARKHALQIFLPRLEFCTDNGAMIAYCGYQHLIRGDQDDLTIAPRARWPLDEIIDKP